VEETEKKRQDLSSSLREKTKSLRREGARPTKGEREVGKWGLIGKKRSEGEKKGGKKKLTTNKRTRSPVPQEVWRHQESEVPKRGGGS